MFSLNGPLLWNKLPNNMSFKSIITCGQLELKKKKFL